MTIRKQALLPWCFLALPLTMYVIWVIFPVFQSMLFSLTHRDSIMIETQFVGLANFLRLFQDKQFHLALTNNLVWLLCFVCIPIPVGLAVAMLFNMDFKGNRLFKTLFYIPMTLSFAVIGTIWAWIYQPDYGVLNSVLRALGMSNAAKQWLGDPQYMTGALVAVGVWRQIPYVMILYLAGLKNVPVELVEAANIDGTSWWQRFRHVVLPLLGPSTIMAVTISIIDSLRSFDIIYVLTNTKARAAEVLASYMYSSAFHYQDYGYGSAIAVVQFMITFLFIIIYVNNSLKREIQR
jgi:multiple sugar transport system permease protein